MDEPSVMATENALMAAALTPGSTVIHNAASEPHVQDLCRLLLQMGARIEGIGSNVLVVHGQESLGGADYTIGPDYIEVGSFIALAACTGGELRIRTATPDDLRMTRLPSSGWAAGSSSTATTCWSRPASTCASATTRATRSPRSRTAPGPPSPPTSPASPSPWPPRPRAWS